MTNKQYLGHTDHMIPAELTSYIAEELKKGVPADVITKSLLAKGWKQEDITAAFTPPSIAHADPAPSPSQAQNPTGQQYYVQAIPAEPASKHPGRIEGIIAIVFAVIGLLFLPPIFGGAGIILGIMSRKKGQKSLGLVAIILSAVFLVLGIVIGAVVNILLKQNSAAKGFVGWFFMP